MVWFLVIFLGYGATGGVLILPQHYTDLAECKAAVSRVVLVHAWARLDASYCIAGLARADDSTGIEVLE